MSASEFEPILKRMLEIHERKGHDYAQEENPYSNFERAAGLAGWFSDPVDKVFATLLGIKLARLAELLGQGKEPKNESVDDTQLDFDTYAVLWHGWRQREAARRLVSRCGDTEQRRGQLGPETLLFGAVDGRCEKR